MKMHLKIMTAIFEVSVDGKLVPTRIKRVYVLSQVVKGTASG
ncbi:hypothetical protein ACLM5H_14315 [Fredinandcohnia humi]